VQALLLTKLSLRFAFQSHRNGPINSKIRIGAALKQLQV
jgi:hypothetical protein